MAKRAHPPAKRGKQRANNMIGKPTERKGKQKKSDAYQSVSYVRYREPTYKFRRSRVKVRRVGTDIVRAGALDLVKMLVEDGILHDKTGGVCKTCKMGKMGGLDTKNVAAGYRCKNMRCRTFTLAHANHPIFSTGKGAAATPLSDQAFTLFCAVHGSTQSLARPLTGKNHKMIEGIYRRNDQCRAQHVERHELEIKYGGKWQDVEADEVDVGGNFAQMVRERVDGEPEGKVKWEQWGGLVQRGEPWSLLLTRLNPVHTHPRAPGPGPVKLTDWEPLARQHLAGKKVILHTDGAQTHNLKIPGMLRDHVAHKKKTV